MLIPAVTIPLSLVGGLFLMLLMGFTINLLTLLAMVLAIGIVVDDAIIVLENIHRHIEEGMSPFDAAIRGARELAWPVVAMTTTLVAVYLPIGFQGGLTGVLFTEFAFTLAGAVLLSGVIALTSPDDELQDPEGARPRAPEGQVGAVAGREFEAAPGLPAAPARHHGDQGGGGVFGLIVLVSCVFLYTSAPRGTRAAGGRGLHLLGGQRRSHRHAGLRGALHRGDHPHLRGMPEVQDYFPVQRRHSAAAAAPARWRWPASC